MTGPSITFPFIAYNKKKAQVGKLDKILVKDVKVTDDVQQYLYVDINNSYWNQADLVSLMEAEELMRAYYERKI